MKKCGNCETNDAVKYSKYSNGEFCSSKCARSFSTKEKRVDINKRVSEKLTRRKTRNYTSIENKIKKSKVKKEYTNLTPDEKWNIIKEKRKSYFNNIILNAEFSTLSFERLRKRIILEQNEKCCRCGFSEWQGEKITLELEHMDGNHHNNVRGNLEALCPNCHSLTPTWRGKNKKNNGNRNRITDDILLKALIENNFNMRQSLLQIGLAAKGGNYIRCHRLKNEYEELI